MIPVWSSRKLFGLCLQEQAKLQLKVFVWWIHEAGGEQGEKEQLEIWKGERKELQTTVVTENPELII